MCLTWKYTCSSGFDRLDHMKLDMIAHACIPVSREVKARGPKIKTLLSYILGWGPTWTT